MSYSDAEDDIPASYSDPEDSVIIIEKSSKNSTEQVSFSDPDDDDGVIVNSSVKASHSDAEDDSPVQISAKENVMTDKDSISSDHEISEKATDSNAVRVSNTGDLPDGISYNSEQNDNFTVKKNVDNRKLFEDDTTQNQFHNDKTSAHGSEGEEHSFGTKKAQSESLFEQHTETISDNNKKVELGSTSSSGNLHNSERTPTRSKGDDHSDLTSNHGTRSQKKSAETMDKEHEAILRSGHYTLSQRESETTDKEYEKNEKLTETLISKSDNGAKSQNKSEITKGEFEKSIAESTPRKVPPKLPPKPTSLTSKFGHGTRSRNNSETREKEYESFANSDHGTRNQKKSETAEKFTGQSIVDLDYRKKPETTEKFTRPSETTEKFIRPSISDFDYKKKSETAEMFSKPSIPDFDYQKKPGTAEKFTRLSETTEKFTRPSISDFDYQKKLGTAEKFTSPGFYHQKGSEITEKFTRPSISESDYQKKLEITNDDHNTKIQKQSDDENDNEVFHDANSGNESDENYENDPSLKQNHYMRDKFYHQKNYNENELSSKKPNPLNPLNLVKKIKTRFGNKGENESTMYEDGDEIKVTFHVHLPIGIEHQGNPVVLGDGDELGNWENPNVTLYRPFPENPTYWRSDPVTISLSKFSRDIQYKYAIQLNVLFGFHVKLDFEGDSNHDNRTLDISRNDQFAIWKNSYYHRLGTINDFAFVDYIYNSISAKNFKDKVMEYQHLLKLSREIKNLTDRTSSIDFITKRIDNGLKENQFFLCLLLGHYILRKSAHYTLPGDFPSGLLLNALVDYKQETLPSGTNDQMRSAIKSLVYHNAFHEKFDWLIIFTIAAEVDPNYTFLDRLRFLKYSKDDTLESFVVRLEKIKPYIEDIKLETYTKLAKWLIQLCYSMDYLLKLWDNILKHNDALDKKIYKCFIEQVQRSTPQSAVALEYHFNRFPKDRDGEVFRGHVLFLLKSPSRKWTNEDITAIRNLLCEKSLNWDRENIIQSLDSISQSHSLELLNIFPDLLDNWFSNGFSDKERKISTICITWFTNLLNVNDRTNESNFVFSIFQRLERLYTLLGHRKNVWEILKTIAKNRVKTCLESQIFGATKFLARIKKQEIGDLFLELMKEILTGSVQRINDQLITQIFIICDCKSETLKVPNPMSEDILCHIITRLQRQSAQSAASPLNVLKANKFWNIILRATGNVKNLHSNPFVKRVKMSVNELARSLLEKNIVIQPLQQLLEYSDEVLFQYFNAAVDETTDMVISRDEIANLRSLCSDYQHRLDALFKFYTRFCTKATDVNDYIQDVERHTRNSNNVKLNQVTLNFWKFHRTTLDSAGRCYKYNRSQTFYNIFEAEAKNANEAEDAAEIKVEYIAQKLVPIIFEKYESECKKFKKWEEVGCKEALSFWEKVIDIDAELVLMEDYGIIRDPKFIQNLGHLIKISHWAGRLGQLKEVLQIFDVLQDDVSHNLLTKSICDFNNDDPTKLGQLNNIVKDYKNLFDAKQEGCWKLIRELFVATEFMVFLKKIADHDIKNLINGVDDHSDERLIREDTVSSLIQVKQVLSPLMDKNKIKTISDFLNELSHVIKNNSAIGEKIALCNSCLAALQNMCNNILNRGEITKEKIKNAVLIGTYTFSRGKKDDRCSVLLTYPSKTNVSSKLNEEYNINEILDLRGRALLITKPKINEKDDKDVEVTKKIMDEFVVQVDTTQEIINTMSTLIQMGHFEYRKFEVKLQGKNQMTDYVALLKDELKKWESIVYSAQEKCYYLTFFPARHILAFYDYFTSEKLDEENKEECKTLIRFVNNKAQLPSRDNVRGILRGSKEYLKVLCKIGDELERIFKDIPKQSRKLKAAGQCVVKKGKLFIAACADKTRVPNIIMLLYANHGYYPEPWQLLICTSLTTMEELKIFIKRSFFASKNGYQNQLFCIANSELLDFELQYDLVNEIRSMQDQEKDFLLALICCKETETHYHILDQFSSDVHATDGLNAKTMSGIYRDICQNVILVRSEKSGQGKTEWIKENSSNKKQTLHSFLISDGMKFGRLVRQFKECKFQPVESLHINIISADYPIDVNMFLFELLTLGIVSTNVDIACLPSSETPMHIFIEVASQRLFDSLPMAGYLLSKHLTWEIKNLKISQKISSPIQISCHYLNLLDRNEIDTKEILFTTDKAIKEPLPEKRCQDLIQRYFFNNNAKSINSFRFVEIFVNVLADQLVRLSSSPFFTVENLKFMVDETNIRTLILNTLIDVSKDFATRFIKTKAADDENAEFIQCDKWENSNHLIVFFNSQSAGTITALYRDRTKVHNNVKTLLKSQVVDGDREKWELEDYNLMSVDTLYKRLEYLARRSAEKLDDLPKYALSRDNLIKMALILLRARANIPVIVCGEAGCGKTSLISYLAMMVEVQFEALNLHAGVAEEDIMIFMSDSLEKAEKGEIWLFFDEINTCNHIGLLADLISHRMLNGKPIHPNIRLFSACNPYRFRTKAQSEAGLTTKEKYEERSNLVYQVKPLPDQILDYIWDYGVLNPKDENKYIQIMVEIELQLQGLADPMFAELLFASQNFIRKVEEPYSVSLRDVKRAIKLVKFFYNSLENRPPYKKGHRYPPPGSLKIRIRSYVLALSLCYYSRLYEQDIRKKYRCEMGQILRIGEKNFAKIIREEQEDYINRMQCPPNTAKNEALLENILVMTVCILTHIPLFLIGAPGSSKSLAIRLISSNLRGFDSNDQYFRSLPQVYLIPHQGSSSSTSDGIIKVFEKAKKFQETNNKQFPIISVVLLDEVGLAETSPFNPLKVLHSLLEPSYARKKLTKEEKEKRKKETEKEKKERKKKEEEEEERKRISVIGISNWRLDNSKSSRALLVQRPQFGLDDLVDTAESLLSTKVIGPEALKPLAKAYSDYESKQLFPNFHGLRDYYSLIKRLSLDKITPENIQMALARNFGGAENNSKLCENHFGNVLEMFNNYNPWFDKPIPTEQLINSNLDDPDARHLMVIGKSDSIVNLLTYQLRRRKLDPVVILGSQFPDDQSDYSYSVLSRIMMCVEAGRPLILTDLEIIYGSLYDLWNQNYIVVGNDKNAKYFARVALGAYANPMLYVSPSFKCILVMDEDKLVSADPPLLNRFEKQKMSINDILDDRQRLLVKDLDEWVKQITTLVRDNQMTQSRNKFTEKDLFIGFNKDETLQSLVIDITKNNPEVGDEEILLKCKECLIAIAPSDGILRSERSALDQEEVNRWKNEYFYQQCHDSLYDYLAKQKLVAGHLVIVNTFSNINTDVKSCLEGLINCQVDKLSTFKTEAQLSNRVKHFWLESTDRMLILQCDVTTVNAGCIQLAKFIIEQFHNEFMTKKDQLEPEIPMKHACIILHMHRDQGSTLASFNFMCGWKQVTIETLSKSKNDIPISGLLDRTLPDIIINSIYPFEKILQQELLWCLLCMKYPSNDKSTSHITMLNEKILEYPNFIECLKARTLEWIEEKSTNDWQYKVASNKQNLYSYASFSLALQAYIRILVRKPIAKILCALERLSATKTFFCVDDQTRSKKNDNGLYDFWKQIYMDKKIIKIEDLPDPKPDGYSMPAKSLYDLKFPFSFYFMKQFDNFKRDYEEEIAILQQDNLTNEDHLKDFKDNIFTSFPQLKGSPLEWVPEIYFEDFITIVAANDGGSKNTKMLARILKLLIGADKVYQPIFLHAYWWKNANEVLAQLQLAQMKPTLIQDIEIQGMEVIEGSLEKYLVKEVTKSMFQRICGNFGGTIDDYSINKWQHDVTKVLFLSNKITQARNLPVLQLLRIVNDLVATKTIPLDSIREIIQFESISDKREVLSEKFVSSVLNKLDELEQNEKNLISIRSFIMRCLSLIPIESDVRLSLYKKLFSNEPFPLMSVIIARIFIKEDMENENIFYTIITDSQTALERSLRLNIINECLKDLDTNMATLCCDVIEHTFFMNCELIDLAPYFWHAHEALYKKGGSALQKIASIALLKEFVHHFWYNFLQDDKISPIKYNGMEEGDFDSDELVVQVNTSMTFAYPLIRSLKIYFLRDLRQRGFSIDDVRQFCKAQKAILPWLATLNLEVDMKNRLPFNPYCDLPEYNDAENGFITFHNTGSKAPFEKFIQNMNQKVTLTAKLSLMGLFFVRLHSLRASKEWQYSEEQSAAFMDKELAKMNLSGLFKKIATKILSNKQPLLQIDDIKINNTDLLLKSVIAHIITYHASVEPNSSQLSMYLHNLQGCQNLFILTCASDIESMVLNAVAAGEKTGITRYSCKCGYVFFVGECGNVTQGKDGVGMCPDCGDVIGGKAGYNKPPEGNVRRDAKPVEQKLVNDQPGYIIEPIEQTLNHSVRLLPPTSYRILHLIVHTLIGASAPEPASAFLRKNNKAVIDAEKYCMNHIRNDWSVLKDLLNCSDEDLSLMFHSLISLMTEKPPLPNKQTRASNERENWETEFHKNYIAPQIRNLAGTVANYRKKLNTALAKNKKNNVIEDEINQTLAMDKQYISMNLPSLWRSIGTINFDSFSAYYMSDLEKNQSNYPFLSVFFKYAGQLELLKHLLPIVRFVQILHNKLGYHLTRKNARVMTFSQFIEKESNNGENQSLKTAFDEFQLGWNTVIPFVERYECHELPNDKPEMNDEYPVVFGLMEAKDEGVFLCGILDYLVKLQNNFLKEVIVIPPGTCRSLKFLDELTFDFEKTKSQSTKPNTPNGYCLQSIRIDSARSGNIIKFDWNDEILAYSQRNLEVARGKEIIYDLAKIEAELANILVFEKVHIETQPETQLYLEPFPYHMELFQGSMRILNDIKNLIPQEPVPIEKMRLLGYSVISNSSIHLRGLDNASEILSSLEILLCFVKRTAVRDGNKPIKSYILQWMKLSSLSEHVEFSKILDVDLRLKHLVALYEFVEEQVANLKIKYINEKYKSPLSADMQATIIQSIDFEQQTTNTENIPAKEFALALKRFMLRFLTSEKQSEMVQLSIYLQDSSLNFWSSTVSEKLVDDLFPENLMVANTHAAYEFIMERVEKIEEMKKKQANQNVNRMKPTYKRHGPNRGGSEFDLSL